MDVRAYDGDDFSLDLLGERDYFHEDRQVELHKLEACSTINNWGVRETAYRGEEERNGDGLLGARHFGDCRE